MTSVRLYNVLSTSTALLVRAKSDGVETKTDFSIVDHGPNTLCKFEARRTVNVVTMANGFECPLYYNICIYKLV